MEGMWQIMEWLDVPPKFLNIAIQLHEDLSGSVKVNIDLSKLFPIINGVKQDRFLLPTLFTIFFSMMIKQAPVDLHGAYGVYIRYHFDGSLFNLQRSQAHMKTLELLLCEHTLADLVAYTENFFAAFHSLLHWGGPALWVRRQLKDEGISSSYIPEEYHPPHEMSWKRSIGSSSHQIPALTRKSTTGWQNWVVYSADYKRVW